MLFVSLLFVLFIGLSTNFGRFFCWLVSSNIFLFSLLILRLSLFSETCDHRVAVGGVLILVFLHFLLTGLSETYDTRLYKLNARSNITHTRNEACSEWLLVNDISKACGNDLAGAWYNSRRWEHRSSSYSWNDVYLSCGLFLDILIFLFFLSFTSRCLFVFLTFTCLVGLF